MFSPATAGNAFWDGFVLGEYFRVVWYGGCVLTWLLNLLQRLLGGPLHGERLKNLLRSSLIISR